MSMLADQSLRSLQICGEASLPCPSFAVERGLPAPRGILHNQTTFDLMTHTISSKNLDEVTRLIDLQQGERMDT